MHPSEHRQSRRAPLDVYLNKVVDDDLFMCRATDISTEGIYLSRLIEPEWEGSRVALEFALPGSGEVIIDRGGSRSATATGATPTARGFASPRSRTTTGASSRTTSRTRTLGRRTRGPSARMAPPCGGASSSSSLPAPPAVAVPGAPSRWRSSQVGRRRPVHPEGRRAHHPDVPGPPPGRRRGPPGQRVRGRRPPGAPGRRRPGAPEHRLRLPAPADEGRRRPPEPRLRHRHPRRQAGRVPRQRFLVPGDGHRLPPPGAGPEAGPPLRDARRLPVLDDHVLRRQASCRCRTGTGRPRRTTPPSSPSSSRSWCCPSPGTRPCPWA